MYFLKTSKSVSNRSQIDKNQHAELLMFAVSHVCSSAAAEISSSKIVHASYFVDVYMECFSCATTETY
jgi:hypothetical protein